MNEIEKAIILINQQKTVMQKYDILSDSELERAQDLAIHALRSQLAREQNEPLTLEEIKSLENTPLWIIEDEDGIWSRFYKTSSMGKFQYFDFKHFGEEFEESYRVDLYGSSWLAYRYKPNK
jgi:hypothetical protein